MEELLELVALAVPPRSRVLAVAPDASLLERLAARDCRTWALVADDGPTLALKTLSEDVAVVDIDRLDVAAAFPGLDFDVVVLVGALAHVDLPAQLLQRVTKPLAPDGRLVVSVPNATFGARRLRSWEGMAQDEEVAPGWPLRRAFTGDRLRQLLGENGLSTVETLRVVRRDRRADRPATDLPPAVLSFLEEGEDARTDHYVVVASPAAGLGTEPVSVAEEMQRRLQRAVDDLAGRDEELAAREREMEALQLDLALKDDFALELRGQVQTVEGRAARAESELAEARAAAEAARQRLAAQEQELDELRRQAGRGTLSLVLHRFARRWAGPR